MNSTQLLALLVCALLALVSAAPAVSSDSLKPEELARYAELAEQERQLEQALREQYPSGYETEDMQPMDKRAQTFVRFGKRAQTFVRFGKRAQTFVRFG